MPERKSGAALTYRAPEGVAVDYLLERSARKTISMRIDERGVRVGAPWQVPQAEIDVFLARHTRWLLRTLARWRSTEPVTAWTDGRPLMLLGRPLRLRLVAGSGVRLDSADLNVGVENMDVDAACTECGPLAAKQVTDWLRLQALECFREQVEHHRLALGLPSPQVRLSNARTRWGSAHASGRIRLNWRLIQMPLPLIDYVAAHEVAHLRVMNHSPRFWQTVATLVPDYLARRAALRTGARQYLVV